MTETETETATEPVFKILRAEEHATLERFGRFAGSPDDERDGYIHLCTRAQLPGTLAKHFPGENDLVILALDAEAMGAALRWERSRDDALFPHLYGALLASMVRGRVAIPAGDEEE